MAKTITEIPKLPPRPDDGYKGLFGKVLIIGGARGMVGATALAANAALRSGAGLVRVALPRSVQLAVAGLTPCSTSIPLPEDENGLIALDAIHDILNALDDNNSIAIGPGMGQSVHLQAIIEKTVSSCAKPVVIDADGLNNLAAMGADALQFNNDVVLTPHPGEMQRLWKALFREPLPDKRQSQAQQLAQRTGAVVVLKGVSTVVTDGQSTYINDTGNPGMATGGSGDVLTGCIGALIANNSAELTPLAAAILAVFIHGRAGDLAAAVLTETAMTASDIIDFLPDAWASIQD